MVPAVFSISVELGGLAVWLGVYVVVAMTTTRAEDLEISGLM
jgi:hypothetical protein